MRPARIRAIGMKTKSILQAILALSGSYSLVLFLVALMERTHLAFNSLGWETIAGSVILAVFIVLSLYAFHNGIRRKDASTPTASVVLRGIEGVICLLCGVVLAFMAIFVIRYEDWTTSICMVLNITSMLILLTCMITAAIYIVKYGWLNSKIEKYGYWMLHLRNTEIALIVSLAPIGLAIKMHWALGIFLYPICVLIPLAGILLALIVTKKK